MQTIFSVVRLKLGLCFYSVPKYHLHRFRRPKLFCLWVNIISKYVIFLRFVIIYMVISVQIRLWIANVFFLFITARFDPDSRGRSVAHLGKVVPSPNEGASRDSNTHSHFYEGYNPLTSSTNYPLVPVYLFVIEVNHIGPYSLFKNPFDGFLIKL